MNQPLDEVHPLPEWEPHAGECNVCGASTSSELCSEACRLAWSWGEDMWKNVPASTLRLRLVRAAARAYARLDFYS